MVRQAHHDILPLIEAFSLVEVYKLRPEIDLGNKRVFSFRWNDNNIYVTLSETKGLI